MATLTVKGLISEADSAIKERNKIKEEQLSPVNEKIASLREILRHLVKAEQATDEEAAWVTAAFPPRETKSKNGDEAEGEGEDE